MQDEEPQDEIIRKVKHEDDDEFHEDGDNNDNPDDPEDDENEAEVVDYWKQSKEDFDYLFHEQDKTVVLRFIMFSIFIIAILFCIFNIKVENTKDRSRRAKNENKVIFYV